MTPREPKKRKKVRRVVLGIGVIQIGHFSFYLKNRHGEYPYAKALNARVPDYFDNQRVRLVAEVL